MVESQKESQQEQIPDSTIKILLDAQKDGSYEKATKFQTVDFENLNERLESLKTVDDQMNLLKYEYTGLYLLINKFKGVSDDEFTDWCKNCDDDVELRTFCIHGWWIPYIDQLIERGKLTLGNKEIEIEGQKF